MQLDQEDIEIGRLRQPGRLGRVSEARAIVVLAQVDGSRATRRRHRQLADVLHGLHLDTLELDLSAPAEGSLTADAGDLGPFVERVGHALLWLQTQPALQRMRVGLFGAGAAAAVVLRSAARQPGRVAAVVSLGGRPDLASDHLGNVQAPTLMIVAGEDAEALRLSREAMLLLRCNKRLEVVPGATRRLTEPGTLDAVAQLAGAWFANQLGDGRKH